MSLTSQIITAEFPDLEKVEQLNTEAFPEEERAPLSELLRYGDGEYSHFFAFYDGDEFVGFAFSVYNERAFYISFFAIICAVTVMVAKLLISWWIFIKEP